MFSPDSSHPPEQPLVQTVLEPLLEDFEYWFGETLVLLASVPAQCLEPDERAALTTQLMTAQQEVATAKTLLLATDGQAGVDIAIVGQWHRLVSRCWQTSRYVRQHRQAD
ncbi:MAG: DUF2605 domain-containing protein [Cyanobacteria bacterium P01_D01_bin.115]